MSVMTVAVALDADVYGNRECLCRVVPFSSCGEFSSIASKRLYINIVVD
jgi:hypothetical protein